VNFEIIDSKKIFSGKVFDVRLDNIKYKATGNLSVREVVLHRGGAVIIALTDNSEILLVKQYRYPFQKVLIELPAGKLDNKEDPVVCAVRELKEETGYTAGNVKRLGSIYTSPGYSSEELHVFLAENLKSGNSNLEEGEEGMEILKLHVDKVVEMILKGEIKDAKTIAGIFFYLNIKNRNY
jgi:ADP-ribose pyrophosphatase